MYDEVPIESLEDRRRVHCLSLFYKIVNCDYLPVLRSILHKISPVGGNYMLRGNRYRLPKLRLDLFKKTFFPTVISMWNALDDDVKQSPTLIIFRTSIMNKAKRNELFYYGERWAMVHHARLRMGCSLLKSHLFNNLHVVDDEMCRFGHLTETTCHFFMECPQYNLKRQSLVRSVTRLTDMSVCNLLFGDQNLTLEENKIIFDAVHHYIRDTERFAH